MTKAMTKTEVLDECPPYAVAVSRLFSWSENFDYPSPATVFIDLIGYSTEQFGETLTTMSKAADTMGYLEIDMLGDALKEYADRPLDIEEYITHLTNAED
jgi:hypothetical protein